MKMLYFPNDIDQQIQENEEAYSTFNCDCDPGHAALFGTVWLGGTKMTKKMFVIPDGRLNSSSGYPPQKKKDRRGQMKRSWRKGVAQRTDGSEGVTFENGLTWGGIGQLLGYLLGEVDDGYKDVLYEQLERAYRGTDHWVNGGNDREG